VGSFDLLGAVLCVEQSRMVSPGLQDTRLIHFEKVRDGHGVIAPAGAGRARPFNPFGFDQATTFSQSRQCAPRAISILILSNEAEKAVLFIGNSSSEINSLAERQKIP
jgi:hypothetical protein